MSENPISFEDVMNYAISREQEAHKFYMDLVQKVKNPNLKKEVEIFAAEEKMHKAKLDNIKARKIVIEPGKIEKLGIADWTVEVEPAEDMDYEDLLILAMKREKEAFDFYNTTASMMEDKELEKLFLMLAREEAAHKLRFESEYDRVILKED
jgi:rubrerythrin